MRSQESALALAVLVAAVEKEKSPRHLSSVNRDFWLAIVVGSVSIIGTISAIILGWRSDWRARNMLLLRIADLQLQISKFNKEE